MAYQVDYVDGQGQRKYLFLSLDRLLYMLENGARTFKCEGGCSDLPTKSQQNVDGPNMNKAISSSRNTRKYPVVLFGQAAAGNAQCLIADLKRLSNMWVLTSMRSRDRAPFWENAGLRNWPVKMLIDRGLVIYLSLIDHTQISLCLFPFTPCLSCMIERGCFTRVHELLQQNAIYRPSCANCTLGYWRRTFMGDIKSREVSGGLLLLSLMYDCVNTTAVALQRV